VGRLFSSRTFNKALFFPLFLRVFYNHKMSVNPNFSDKSTLEKYSSTFSLSDMEIYVFPELLYPLVIANIMSPIIWKWRDDPWFKDVGKKSFVYKINRIKQYIMEHYVFNLDLDTWGLTTKEKEISRFSGFMDMNLISQSNALFGYEGDKYYFDIDIRRHFGLDSYTGNIIPYWKTETVEAMSSFHFKESFMTGAGECVSLSALYAAALFIVGRIPLENIFLIGTPLHSQNFIDINEGVLTNNRRIVTKKMWFNGTSMSSRARRALENEKVSLVSHISGYIHHAYEKATMHPGSYQRFTEKLGQFLITPLTPEVFINFLRYNMQFKSCFQYRFMNHGHEHYIGLETIFTYEHNSRSSFSFPTREALLNEIDDEEFSHSPLKNRIMIQDAEKFLEVNKDGSIEEVSEKFLQFTRASECNKEETVKLLFKELGDFLRIRPRLPDNNKVLATAEILDLHTEMTRQEILDYISAKSGNNEVALLSLYTYRQMDKIDWKPFAKTALERNPVALEGLKGKNADKAYHLLLGMPGDSIYDGQRLAQPDEVWNFGRGDGLEKAFVLANFLYNEASPQSMKLIVEQSNVILEADGISYQFVSEKGLTNEVNLVPDGTVQLGTL